MSDYFRQNSNLTSFGAERSWVVLSGIEQNIKHKIEKAGTPLKEWGVNIYRGILTGYNDAFIISQEVKDKLVSASPKNAEIIRPILRGRDIRRYKIDFAHLYLLEIHNGLKASGIKRIDVINNYPTVYEHLKRFLPQIESRADQGDHWTNLRNCAYLRDFDKPKIIYPGLMRLARNNREDFPRFYLDESNTHRFTNDTYFMIGGHLKYLLGLLNSKLYRFLFPYYIYSFDSDGFKVFTEYFEKIPFADTSKVERESFEDIVTRILAAKQNNVNSQILENKLNEIIFNLYGLDSEEIAYVNKRISGI